MFGDDAPAMDAPAMLAESLSNAGLAFRPVLTIGDQPRAVILALEIQVKAVAA
jgi:molybdopterin-biosynthesis enzyme MoeA-like protein